MYQPSHLAALVAVVDHGTFDAAARSLHVTPSAISQRIRALESQVGKVVITRATPCAATAAGDVLVALGRQSALLAAEASAQLGQSGGSRTLAVAVNADSLATWFRDVMSELADWGVALEVFVEDQAHSTRLLREGRVMAAVTSEVVPVQGCRIEPIGSLTYHPVVARSLAERCCGSDGLVAALRTGELPMVRFNEIDALQHDWLAAVGASVPGIVHRIPTTVDFGEAVRRGLGWGMYLDGQLADGRAAAEVVELAPLLGVDPVVVPLFWQRWRLSSPLLDDLTAAVLRVAPSNGVGGGIRNR